MQQSRSLLVVQSFKHDVPKILLHTIEQVELFNLCSARIVSYFLIMLSRRPGAFSSAGNLLTVVIGKATGDVPV